MKIKTFLKAIAIGCGFLAALMIFDGLFEEGVVVRNAEARLGRPMTPGSVAGVARRTSRRTTRRVIRRTAVFVAALPVGCATTVVISGTTLHHCGGVYYQASGAQYVVVNVE